MRKVLMLMAILAVSISSMVSADIWVLNTDMDASVNDNGIWSYGYAVGDPNDPNVVPTYKGLMVDSGTEVGANILWWKELEGALPHIWVGPEVGVPAGVHGMKGGYTTTGPAVEVPAVIRWTAPASLVIPTVLNMDVSLYLTQGGLEDVYIVKSEGGDPNQRTILLEEIGVSPPNSSHPLTYSTSTLSVIAGDTVDVMVAAHGPDDWATTDWNAVSISIADKCTEQLPMDFNWDCYVNMEDLAILAGDWLTCNDPQNPNCTPPVVPTVLRVDFNGYNAEDEPNNPVWTTTTPGLLGVGTFWNGLEVSYETPNTISAIYPGPALLLHDGVTDSGVTVTLSGVTLADLYGPNVGNTVFQDYILSTVSDPNLIITISGLIPGNAYSLAGYGGNGGDHVGGIWTANGVGPMDLTWYVADQGILNDVIADENGQIIIEIEEDPIANAHLTVVNGFELAGTFQAEPVNTCQTNGIYEELDFNEDCYVNLGDYADFAQSWLTCNDPLNPNCATPVVANVLRIDFNGYNAEDVPFDNIAATAVMPGLLGDGTFWNGLEVSYATPNTISAVYPGPALWLNDGVTDSQVSIALSGFDLADSFASANLVYKDYLLDTIAPIEATITINGLVPGNSYNLAAYGSNGDAGYGAVWSANGSDPLDLSTPSASQGVIPNVLADSSGVITIQLTSPATNVIIANGFELEGTFQTGSVE